MARVRTVLHETVVAGLETPNQPLIQTEAPAPPPFLRADRDDEGEATAPRKPSLPVRELQTSRKFKPKRRPHPCHPDRSAAQWRDLLFTPGLRQEPYNQHLKEK